MTAEPPRHPHHLVTVWNPALAVDAMEAHLAVLLEMVRQHEQGRRPVEDAYVWWGQVRSANRQTPRPHLDEVLALDDAIPEDDASGREIHLYLTDYRSLYVGHVMGITERDMRAEDPDHVPAYYAERGLACDCWFELWDLRRVVQDDTLAVVAELKKLRNVHYHDRPVSIYGGMVDLPLVVWREDAARFFDAAERERVLEGRHWVEFDAEHAGVGAMQRELRDNLVGERAWALLALGTRTFVATAERTFRDNRANAGFDFAGVIGGLAKALEVECNARLRQGLRRAPREQRLANVEGETLDLAAGRHLSLGQLARVLGEERGVAAALQGGLANATWFTNQLPYVLEEFRKVRNEGAHVEPVGRDAAVYWRDRILGVGERGILVELAGVGMR